MTPYSRTSTIVDNQEFYLISAVAEYSLALKWQDKREVWMLSTGHSVEYKDCKKKNYQTGEQIQKSSCCRL